MTNSLPKLAFSFTFAVFGLSRFHREKWRVSPSENEVWLGAESNRRHEDFQSSALPTELPSRIALPLSRFIERRVLIKAENAQPSTPSCSGGLSALYSTVQTSSLDVALSCRCRASISACCFLCGRRERLPYKVAPRRAHPMVGRRSAESGKDLRRRFGNRRSLIVRLVETRLQKASL